MSPACRRCRREHPPVSLAEWTWIVRDYQPKPAGKALGVLWMLAARLDPATGCGWTTEDDLAELAQLKDAGTVRSALRWAQARGLICRAVRGHHIIGTPRASGSLWVLAEPSTTRDTATVVEGSTTRDLSPHNTGSEHSTTRAPSPDKRDQVQRDQKKKDHLSRAPAARSREDNPAAAAATETTNSDSQDQDQQRQGDGPPPAGMNGQVLCQRCHRLHPDGTCPAADDGRGPTCKHCGTYDGHTLTCPQLLTWLTWDHARAAETYQLTDEQARALYGHAAAHLAEHGFDVFWHAYPRKIAKGAARTAWQAATGKAKPSAIIAGAAAYRDNEHRASQDAKYTANPANWLDGERWADADTARGDAGNGRTRRFRNPADQSVYDQE